MKARSHIRTLLKEATDPVHQRLHQHKGLGAVAARTITRSDYTKLIARLYGFHSAFDDMLDSCGMRFRGSLDLQGRQRAWALASDLKTLGWDQAAISALPICADVPAPETRGALMGALYVIEGSTLGGLQLARALTSLFGNDQTEGRRFFGGYGEKHGAMWQAFLAELDACVVEGANEADIVAGAQDTFGAFEAWMDDWHIVSESYPSISIDKAALLAAR